MLNECLYRVNIHPPFRTGRGAPFLLGEGSRSTSSFPVSFLDSEDPFCRREMVRITNSAVCKNSLSQFSKVDWIKCPELLYCSSEPALSPSFSSSLLYSLQPEKN